MANSKRTFVTIICWVDEGKKPLYLSKVIQAPALVFSASILYFIESKKVKTNKSHDTLINQINHFSKVVQKKMKPKVTGEDGLISLKIFDAITKSANSGKKIKI